MHTTRAVFRYELRNLLRGRAVVGYALFFALATTGLVAFGGGAQRALPSLTSLVLLVAPLVSLLVTVIALYDGADFAELVLSHPVTRRSLVAGRFAALVVALAGAFAGGVAIPLALLGLPGSLVSSAVVVVAVGALLSAAFVALGFLVAVLVREPARGLGAALLLWLGLTLVYDGVVLALSQAFTAYPLERPLLIAMMLNPVDVARVAMMVAVDAAALAGYTGAVFTAFFGGPWGAVVVGASLTGWITLPWLLAARRFRSMDL